jgi:hypothetical protein
MDEPDLFNHTDFAAEVLPIIDRTGAPARTVIVKATYSLADPAALRLADKQNAVRLGHECWGPPEVLDIRLPSDYGLPKEGTDFVLSACAVAPRHRTPTSVDVDVQVAGRHKVLRVHGPRHWQQGIAGVVPSPAQALVRVPLAWSRAWGGLDISDPAHPLEEPRNPVGSGVTRSAARLVGLPAPQIESPAHPIRAAGGSNEPQGCAPIAPHFAPRRHAAGTYDENWLKSVYPARPADYKSLHENCAVPDLQFADGLRGGEPVYVAGTHAERIFEFRLPKWLVHVRAQIDGALQDQRPSLDTVVVDTEALTLELVWRAQFACPARMRDRFTGIRVDAKEFLS